MTSIKYPLILRLVHWARALIVLSALTIGTTMTWVADEQPVKFEVLYPWHKQLGVLALLFALTQLVLRCFFKAPPLPAALKPWERIAAKAGHVGLQVLMVVVPVMGYCMSSSFEFSDGVPFFGTMLPELLPKSEVWFERFQLLHKVLGYTLLALVVSHIAGALKHRLFDRDPEADVLRRML